MIHGKQQGIATWFIDTENDTLDLIQKYTPWPPERTGIETDKQWSWTLWYCFRSKWLTLLRQYENR